MPICPRCQSPTLPDGRCLSCSGADDPSSATLDTEPPPTPEALPSALELGPGARIGDFTLLEAIDQGAMGEVWRAEHAHLHPGRGSLIVAVKLMLPSVAARPELRDRFAREARAHARVEHPAIPRFYACGEVHGRPYLVMGFVPGPTLARLIASKGPLPPARVRDIGAQLASALDHLHRAGIVHRDLKPANIKVVDDGGRDRVMVLDLGICKALDGWDDSLATRNLLGTPLYMAPEQLADAGRVEPATDQFALGGLLYEMLTGRAPFAAGNAAAVLVRIQTHEPPPPSTVAPGSSDRSLDDIIARLLQKAPGARFPDMAAVAAALAPDRVEPAPSPATVTLVPGRPSWWQLVQLASGLVAAGVALTAYTCDRSRRLETPAVVDAGLARAPDASPGGGVADAGTERVAAPSAADREAAAGGVDAPEPRGGHAATDAVTGDRIPEVIDRAPAPVVPAAPAGEKKPPRRRPAARRAAEPRREPVSGPRPAPKAAEGDVAGVNPPVTASDDGASPGAPNPDEPARAAGTDDTARPPARARSPLGDFGGGLRTRADKFDTQ